MAPEGKFVLSNLPMPPSSNRQYWAKGYVRNGVPLAIIAPSKELDEFKKTMAKWALGNSVAVAKARKFIREEILLKDRMIQFDTYVCLHGTQLWTQKNFPKKIDATNRIKALHDCMAEILQVDDSFFWSGYVEKIETAKPEPYCFVVIKPFAPRAASTIEREKL